MYAANLVDGPPSDLRSKSARLRLLEEHQRAWNNLSWTAMDEIQLTPEELETPELSAWELASGVLAFAQHRAMRFIQFPSRLRGIPRAEWAFDDVGFKIRDFAMDRSQDLLVILELYDQNVCVHS